MEDPTVFLIDDDPTVRSLIQILLSSAGLHVEMFASPRGFLEAYDSERAGCAVVDVCMPGMTGLELQATLSDPELGRPHIILTGHADVAMVVQAFTQGAFGFLEKPFRAHELLHLVLRALDKDREERNQKRLRRDVSQRMDSLSPREHEILQLIMQGEQNKTIAVRLNISQRTVELHRARVMEKLGVDSVAELVQMAMLSVGKNKQ